MKSLAPEWKKSEHKYTVDKETVRIMADNISLITILTFSVQCGQSPRLVPNSVILLKNPGTLNKFRVNNPGQEENIVGKYEKKTITFQNCSKLLSLIL